MLYADVMTDSMRRAIAETDRRRTVQQAYNAEHGIDPQTIRKAVTDLVAQFRAASGAASFEEGAPLPAGHQMHSDRSRRAGRRATERIAASMGVGSGGGGTRFGGASGAGEPGDILPADELERLIATLESEMHAASAELRFEYAARLRDEIRSLRRELREVG